MRVRASVPAAYPAAALSVDFFHAIIKYTEHITERGLLYLIKMIIKQKMCSGEGEHLDGNSGRGWESGF